MVTEVRPGYGGYALTSMCPQLSSCQFTGHCCTSTGENGLDSILLYVGDNVVLVCT